ncbi:MauE/DoxX family redox-associated membrane protein [Microtetraspora sp. NBRC 13810]|uniref:MauE/DoxX family redox-associated membrane protein n=1 Tax=Microtetraspora sp. NBRC 13810 TaxID=3030990 RepID=UPI002555BBD6|nr:MauE/DoxX family redox-associated membrane protein [Microtetraspora sp. NBRC 13810]
MTIAAAQLPLLVVLLALGAVAKPATARGDDGAGPSSLLGPAALVPEKWRTTAVYAAALGELMLAAGLAFTEQPVFRWAALGFFGISTYVLLELRQRRPDAGCGCFGEVSARPIGLRAIARTLVLGVMAISVLTVPSTGWAVVTGLSWSAAGAMACGVLVLAALSPELEELIARLRYRAPCEQRPLPVDTALTRLRASSAWRGTRPLLDTEEPADTWRELCWRFFVYPGRSAEGELVDVVFAVYLSGRRPPVRVTLVTPDGLPLTSVRENIPVSA